MDFEVLKKITTGAVRIEKENDGIHFYRFTKDEEDFYKNYGDDFYYSQVFATAGVKMAFKTDGESIFIKGRMLSASARKYYSVDVMKNGEYLCSIDNYENVSFPDNYIDIDLKLGNFSKEIDLGKGEKEIVIHLPWSANCIIEEFFLENDTYIEPVRKDKKILCYGDSITQGYDALHSSMRYAARICNLLGGEEINKAIGGERFNPLLSQFKSDISPEIITVAYGTNDISCDGLEKTIKCAKDFFENLCRNYPDAVIYAITPIWRGDYKSIDNFEILTEKIISINSKHKNVKVIDGFNLVPANEKYFGDIFLHPTDEGFKYYTENLFKEIAKKK